MNYATRLFNHLARWDRSVGCFGAWEPHASGLRCECEVGGQTERKIHATEKFGESGSSANGVEFRLDSNPREPFRAIFVGLFQPLESSVFVAQPNVDLCNLVADIVGRRFLLQFVENCCRFNFVTRNGVYVS